MLLPFRVFLGLGQLRLATAPPRTTISKTSVAISRCARNTMSVVVVIQRPRPFPFLLHQHSTSMASRPGRDELRPGGFARPPAAIIPSGRSCRVEHRQAKSNGKTLCLSTECVPRVPDMSPSGSGYDQDEASEEPDGSGQDFARLFRAARMAMLCHGGSLAHECSADSSKGGR